MAARPAGQEAMPPLEASRSAFPAVAGRRRPGSRDRRAAAPEGVGKRREEGREP